jgi:hypothetical protein
VREDGGQWPRTSTLRRGLPRSKWIVALSILAVMLGLFTAGVVWRLVSPPVEDRVIDELPVYPGAREAGFPATPVSAWAQFTGFGDAVVVSYVLPRGASRDGVLRYFGTHMPRSFRREGSSCWARGDTRVLLVPGPPRTPTLDIAVDVNGAECPEG